MHRTNCMAASNQTSNFQPLVLIKFHHSCGHRNGEDREGNILVNTESFTSVKGQWWDYREFPVYRVPGEIMLIRAGLPVTSVQVCKILQPVLCHQRFPVQKHD